MTEKHVQLIFVFGPDEAEQSLEDLIKRAAAFMAMTDEAENFIHQITQVCAAHPGTTVGPDLTCDMCLIDELGDLEVRAEEQDREGGMNVRTEEAIWELEGRIDALRTQREVIPGIRFTNTTEKPS